MGSGSSKRKQLLRVFLPALFLIAAGLSFFAPDAEAVQIKKIQKGDIYLDLDDMSATATIQSVDQNKSLLLIFVNPDYTTYNYIYNSLFTVQFESDNTIVVSRDFAQYVPVTVTYYVIEFADGVNVQRGISSFIYGAYANPDYRIKNVYLPESVDQNKSFAIVYSRCYSQYNYYDEMALVTGRITGPNTLELQRDASYEQNRVVNLVWQVVEFQTDAEVMSGMSTIAVDQPNVTTSFTPRIPTGEIDKCMLLYQAHAGQAVNGVEGYYRVNGTISNEGNVSFWRGYDSATANTTVNISWSVVHFNDSATYVQRGVEPMASGLGFRKVAVGTAYDAERAFFFSGLSTTSNVATTEDETLITPGGEIFKGVCYDNSTNSVWVTGYATGNVYKFNATTGAYINNYTVGDRPVAVCYDNGTQDIWVANYGNSTVTRLNAADGAFVGHYSVGPNPIDICYQPSANNASVWTANFGGPSTANATTRIWTGNGTVVNLTGYANRTMSVCYDPFQFRIYCAHWATDRLGYFNPVSNALGSRDIGATNQFYSRIRYAPTAADIGYNTLWATSLRYHYVARIYDNVTGTGAPQVMQFYPELAPQSSIWNPNTSTVWIANYASNKIDNMTTAGVVSQIYNTSSNPYDLAYDPNNTRIWVTASNARELQAFDASTGAFIASYTLPTEQALYLTRGSPAATITVNWQIAELAPITLKTPNGGQTWRIGDTQRINWSYADSVNDHKVSLMIAGGNTTTIGNYIYPINTSASLTAEFNGSGANGTYNWTIPASITNSSTLNLMNNSLRVAIIDENLSITGRNYDLSNLPFEIIGDIYNVAPSGTGTTFYVGQTHPITWSKRGNFNYSSTGANTNFTIQLSTDGTNGNYTNISGLTNLKQEDCACSAADDDCSYNWVVPFVFNGSTPLYGSIYKVRVYENSHSALVYNTSQDNFTITGAINVVTPNGPENWTVGETTRYINWTKQGNYTTSNFTIALSTNGGSGYTNIPGMINLTPAACNCAADDDCSVLWSPVPDNVSNTLKIRVYAAANPAINDSSNDNFTVKALLNLTYPSAAGISWNTTENGTINWTKTGNWSGNRVNLTYSIFGGVTDAPIPNGTDVDGNLGTFTWYNITPDAISEYVKIKVTSNQSEALQVSNESVTYMAIRSLVMLTSPDSGTFNIGDPINVTWHVYGDMPNGLHIGYTNGSGWVKLTSSAVAANQSGDGNGTWGPWSVPDWATSETVKFRVANNLSDDLGTPYDDSNSFIKLRGNLTVGRPNATDIWRVGETNHTITWTPVGFKGADTVKISFSPNGAFGADTQVLTSSWSAISGSYPWSPIPNNTSINNISKVRVEWTTNDTVKDESDGFSIKGTLNVVAPNGGGGQNFSVNTTMPIQWNSTGDIGNISLKYSIGGTNYTVSDSQFPQNGSYEWPVPRDAELSENVRIRVVSFNDSYVTDTSNNDFAIRGAIHVVSPNGGETWPVGTSRTISWTRDGDRMGPVTLKYTTDDSNYINITDTPVNVTNGTNNYAWNPVPDVMAANDSKVYSQTRVRIFYDNYTYDDSNNTFSLVPNFNVTNPTNSSVKYANDTINITWRNDGKCSRVRIYYSYAGGAGGTWERIHGEDNLSAPYTDGYNGSYEWTVPWQTLGDDKVFSVNSGYDNNTKGVNTFNISAKVHVTSPALNDSKYVGEGIPALEWEYHGPTGDHPVNISFYNGSGWSSINASTNGTSYAWPVEDKMGYPRRIRVTSLDQTYAVDESDNFFIKGKIQLITPNGGESYSAGGTMNITWGTVASLGLLNITYSADNGTDNYTYLINNNTDALTGYYNWAIPADFGTTMQGKIKVQSRSYNDTFCAPDTSNTTFSIRGTVTLLTPDPNATNNSFAVGSKCNITWNNTGGISYFNVYASYNNGSDWEQIGYNVSGSLKYLNWTVTDHIQLTPQLKFMVEDAANPAANATSANPCAVRGSIHVVSPNNGTESWVVGSNQSIQWRPTGSYPGNVKFYYSNDSGGNWSSALGEASAGEHNTTQTWYWEPVPNDIGAQVKIRVATDTGNSLIDTNDTSNNTFKIKGSILVTQPNGGQAWFVNDTNRQIKWNAVGTVTPVKIEYTTGGTYSVITDNFTGSAGVNEYNWTPIPDRNNETCLVRVSDNRTAFVSEVTDVSNATFSIRPQITVYTPGSGDYATAGANGTQPIRWNYTGTTIGDVKVEYTINGTDWYDVDPDNADLGAGNGTGYFWPNVPMTKSATTRLRVYDVNNTYVVGNSSQFNIRGSLNLTSPVGTENWAVGSQQFISWNSAAVTLVNVSYSLNNGSWVDLGSSATSPYTWNISNNSQVSNQVRIRIADQYDFNVTSISTNPFAILPVLGITHPELGDNVTAEGSYNITWSSKGVGADFVYLQYTPTGHVGGNWTNVTGSQVANGASGGYYIWNPVPAGPLSNYCKLKVTYADNANATDQSEDYFRLRGALAVTAPTDGQSWQIGQSTNITWTRQGNIALVNILYSDSNGDAGTWATLASGANASSLSWQWNITNTTNTTAQGKIRVADAANPDLDYGTSSGIFSIKGSLNLSTPSASGIVMTYDGSSTYNIAWSKEGGISLVNLSYSTNNGTTYLNAIENNVSATASPYAWTIPNNIGSGLRVKINAHNDPSVNSTSLNSFGIKGSLIVTSPNGNESWLVGSNQSITWNTTGTYPGYSNIYYSNDSGGNWTLIGEALTNDKVWYWDPVPDDITAGAMIRVMTNTTNASIDVNDSSNNTFRVRGQVTVLEPNGNDHWFVNDTSRQIRWNAIGTVTPVRIEYSTGGSYMLITNNATGVSGSSNAYNWTPIPDNKSETCLVRVSDNRTAFLSTVTDVSNNNFTILPQIDVHTPAANDNATAGASGTQAIRWNYTGHTIERVNIEYFDGANWTSIQTNVNNTNNASSYLWPNVPSVKNSQAKIRVTDTDISNISDESGIFSVRGSINLTSPLGNASLPVGSNQLIQWQASAITTVNISYSLNNGTNWTYLGIDDASPFSWNISNSSQVSNQVKVRVADHDDQLNTSSTSPWTFATVPVLDLQHPQSGDNVTAEGSYNITWTSKGLGADYVYLQWTPTGIVGGNWTNVTDGQVANGASGGYFVWNPAPAGPLSNYCKLRVTYAGNANATDEGEDYFRLRGVLGVTAPTDGQSWQIGQSTYINWTRQGNIAAVNLLYSSDNGGNWTTLPGGGGVNASLLSWQWNITNATNTTSQGKIRVADTANPDLDYGTSSGVFSIKGSLNLSAPSASGIVMTYDGSSTYNIAWSKEGGISLVNLSYSTNGGTNYNNIIENNVSATASPYAWTIPNNIGSQLKVKVAVEGDPSVNSTSLNSFAIKGSLIVTSPNGNESWLVGTNQSITWNTTGTYPGNCKIYFSQDGGGNWTEIGETTTNNKVWYWDPVPDNITSGGMIRVATNTGNASIDVNDSSNTTFSIRGSVTVLEPNGNDHWFVNDTNRQIKWNAIGTVTPVKIEYSTGGSYMLITNNATGVSGSSNAYNWTPIPDNRSETCLVRVSDNRTAFTGTVTDVSNNNFTILPQIDIYLPVTDANVTASANGTQPIRWNYTGHTIGRVNIEYSLNNGLNWTSIQANVNNSGNASTYNWPNVPATKTSQGLIRVTDVDMPNVTDDSGSFFIRGYLSLTSPLGNANVPVGSTQLITWSQAAITTINISYTLNNGTQWTYLGIDDASPFSWNISNTSQVSNQVRVRVADHDDQGNTSSISANTFAIIPVFDIEHPESGDNITAEESYNVSWTTRGLGADNVYLQYTPTGQTGANWTNITNGSITNLNIFEWNPTPQTISNYTKVRIFYADNINATNEGEDYFNLRGSILVTSPNGDESWQIGEVRNITWTKKGTIASFAVSYSPDNGGNWTALGSTGASPYAWNITSDTTTTTIARIKVADSTNPAIVFDTSNSTFEVKGRLNISQPDGGQVLTYDGGSSSYNVIWTKEGGISRVNLTYSTNNGVTYPNSIAANISSTASPHAWTVPDAVGSTLRVHVEDVDNPSAVYDNSTSNFAIKGSLIVTSPNGNESWLVGTNQSITWNTTGTYPGNCKIYFSQDGGGNWTEIGETTTNNKVWYWDPVPDNITSGGMIRVATNTGNASIDVNDSSNTTFSIRGSVTVLEPNGNDHWFVNDTNRQIRWNAIGTVTPVKIEYSLTGGSSWIPVTNNYTGVSGSSNAYNWTIPDNRSEICVVKVSDNRTAFTSVVTDISNANFTILPQIDIYLPATNDNVTASANGTQPIRWNYTGHTIDKVNIEYSLNNGLNWTSIQANVNNSGNASTYNWPNVPATKTSEGLVRVTDVDMANVTDTAGTFFIRGFLNLTSPLGNVNWPVGSSQLITWSSSAITTINVSYTLNNGTNWTYLGIDDASPFSWNISNNSQVSNQVRVRVADHDDQGNTSSVSANTFAIVPILDIVHPQSGDNVTADGSYNVTWTSKGLGADNVYLQWTPTGIVGGNWTNVTDTQVANGPTGGYYVWSPTPAGPLSNYCKLRVTYAGNANATDEGEDYFRLKGILGVTAPTDGQSWQIGQSTYINWTRQGNIATVNILYSDANGTAGTWSTLATATNASALSWQWNITNTTNTTVQGKIRVADSSNPDLDYGTSSGVFSIKGSLNLSTPSASGIVMTHDGSSTYNIAWSREGGISLVNLSYSTNGGTSYNNIIENNVSATASPYAWPIPNIIGSTLKVKVNAYNDPSVNSTSLNNFAIKGSLIVTSPNGNESWLVGTNQSIAWNTTGTYPGNCKIYFSQDGGGNWTEIGETTTNDKVWYWDPVPDNITSTGMIRVATNTGNASIDVNDSSNNTFRIRGQVTVLEPNGNEHWFVNDTSRQIRWNAIGTVTPVKIEYSLTGGSSWIPVTNNYTGVSGSSNAYNWTPIPDNKSEICVVRVSDNRTAFTSVVTDISNANFTILPQIEVYQPAANANVTASANGTQPIRWNYTGHTIDKVNIEYSLNNGLNWTSIQANVNNSGNASTYNWPNVPATKTSEGLIRVTDVDMANVTDTAGTFFIRGFLNLTSPLGNVNWPVGSSQLITWGSSAITTINVSYSLNNGTNWTYLGIDDASPFSWNISNNSQVSNQVRVRVADHDDQGNTSSVSANTFAIVPILDIVHPQSGDNVTAEESYNISWTSKGLGADNVYLQYTPTGQVGGNWTNVTDAAVPNGASGGYYLWNPTPAGPLSNYYKVRVAYADNANATDTGEDYFNFRGKITLLTPDGGESWQIGEVRNVSWERKGQISAVDVLYSSDNGTNWTTLPNAAAVNASSGNWSWNITSDTTTSRQAKIRVADSNNPAIVFDSSGASFELRGRIDITQPNATGVVLTYDAGQSSYNIIWNKLGNISSVNLSYSTNNGSTYPNSIATDISSTASPHAWTIPNAIGSTLRVKVEDYDNPTVNATSANNFAIKGAIQLISPNGNESWLAGSNQSIQWVTTGTYPGNVKIYFSNNSGSNWTEIGTVGAGQHNVTQTWYWDPVPDDITASGLVRVATQVNNTSVDVYDDSNTTFKVRGSVMVTQPNGAEIWYANDTNRQIRWTAVGTVTPVKIEYSSGGSYNLITNNWTGISGINIYNWTPVPQDVNSETCRVRVTDNRSSFGEVNDTSNNTFSIRPQIFIQQPLSNANITASANGTQAIRWNYTGTTIGDVKVEYTPNGTTWYDIDPDNSNLKVENGSAYSWPTVPTLKTTQARIRVYDVNNTNVVANSSTFNIVGYLNLTDPVGNNNFPVGSSQYIQWQSAAVTTFNLSYSLNNGANWTYLGIDDASPFAWNISNTSQVSNQVKVRVADHENLNVSSISPSTFAIIPVLDVQHPESGDNVTAEEYYNITWTSRGTGADSIYLQYTPTGQTGQNWTNVTDAAVPNGASGGYYLWNPTPSGPISNYYKVRVIYSGNANATDTGADYFNFRGNVTVTRPSGGEVWNISTAENITWTKKGNIPTVDIAYSLNNGSAGTWVPIATVNSSLLIYPWNITNVTTTFGKIKVADSANPDIVYDVSEGLFSIKGRIAVTYPFDPGIILYYGNTTDITWQKFGDIPYVNISYSSTGGGAPWTQVVGNWPGASYPWEVPDAIGSAVRVRIWDSADPTVNNMSGHNFSIFGKIKVDKPDSPTEPEWVYGTNQTIQWTRTGTFYYFNIEGSSNGFADNNHTWTIATNYYSVSNTSFFNYTLTGDVSEHLSNNVKIRISDAAAGRGAYVRDESDNPFIIKGTLNLMQPNGNESWSAGTNQTIRWNAGGNISTVKLEYLDGAGSIPVLISDSVSSGAGIHDYIWNVSEDAVNSTKQAYVRVTHINDSSVNDTSDDSFLIKGSIDLLTPSGGERLLVDENFNITWLETGNYKPPSLDTVKIEYSTNGTSGPWKSVHNQANQSGDAVPADTGYFVWKVDDDLSNNVRIRINRTASEGTIAPDFSGSSFSIIGKLTVQDPGPGVTWRANDTYTIKWQRQGSIGLVDIGYFINGTNYQPIVSSWPGSSSGNTTGNYSWNIENITGIVSPNVTINVSDHNDSSVYNVSQQFRIVPKFLVNTPAAGEKLVANRQMYITWSSWGGDFGPVNISYTDLEANQSYVINSSAPNLGSYSWVVNDTLSNNVRVRVAYPSYGAAYNDSGPFYIWPNYTVKAPTSSADHKWPARTVQQIRWNCTSARADYVNLLYSLDGGLNYDGTIANNVNNSYLPAHEDRIYNWTVADSRTHSFRVRVEDANTSSRPNLNATSPSNSWIIAYFNITYPQGNETLTVNDPFTINWTSYGVPQPNVTLNISTVNFTTDDNITTKLINARTDNDGSYTWQVPDMISKTVKVRIADADEPPAYDDTVNFTIAGKFNVTAPFNGNRFNISQDTTVTWTTVGTIPKVNITVYNTLPVNYSDPNFTRFNYTPENPLVIVTNYTNNGSYVWNVNDTATAYARLRVSDYNYPEVSANSSGNFSIIGSFNVTEPGEGDEFLVAEERNITWVATGSSITQVRVSYSLTGAGGSYLPVNTSWNSTANGIVNNGVGVNVLPIRVPDYITPNFTVFFKVEDPADSSVYSISGNTSSGVGTKIRGAFNVLNPVNGTRWVTYENYTDIQNITDDNGTVMNRTIIWNTTGTVPWVNLVYSTGGFLPNNTFTIYSDITNTSANIPNSGHFNWTVPLLGESVPYFVKIRIMDANDTSAYSESETFKIDFYDINWIVRDALSFMIIPSKLNVTQDSVPPWTGVSLSQPQGGGIVHKTPYSTAASPWNATWDHPTYGEVTVAVSANKDKNLTALLMSKIVHVWEAKTDYIYEVAKPPADDMLSFRSYLVRDGTIAGGMDENGVFHTVAVNCRIEVYDPTGVQIKNFTSTNITEAGFFTVDWPDTQLSSNITYSAVTEIQINEEAGGGKFRTPFVIDLSPTVSLYNVYKTITDNIDAPLNLTLRQFESNLTGILTNQTVEIGKMMDNQTDVIENRTELMQDSVNKTMQSFESRTYQAIEDLKAGANETIEAGKQALNASAYLEATAKKYSWSASVSPNPSLPGDEITITCQGEPSKLPELNVYSWDNKNLIANKYFIEQTEGLYTYTFDVDSRFTPGKAYTYVITEPDTGGLIAGSGTVEAMSMTSIAGLAAAAPEAERTAKKILDAVSGLESMLRSRDNTNIAVTLKSIKDSIDQLPATLAKEGVTGKLAADTINEIAARIKKLAGEEGYDLKQLLEESLGDNPTIKEVRSRTETINSVVEMLLKLFESKFGGADTPVVSMGIETGSVVFRIYAANPSKTKTQKVDIKNYLPQEVRPKDIIDASGMDIDYDHDKGIYYVYRKGVELGPSEIRTFQIEVEDIWFIAQAKLDDLRTRTEAIMAKLENTDYYMRGKDIADSIYKRLQDISASQADETVSRSQHIGIYRQNVEIMEQIKEDIAKLEKILATAGGPLAPEMLAKTKVKAESPTKTITWIVIFTIIIFVSLLAGVLFFTWHRQSRYAREELLSAKKAAFPGSEDEQAPPPEEKQQGQGENK